MMQALIGVVEEPGAGAVLGFFAQFFADDSVEPITTQFLQLLNVREHVSAIAKSSRATLSHDVHHSCLANRIQIIEKCLTFLAHERENFVTRIQERGGGSIETPEVQKVNFLNFLGIDGH